MGIFTRNASIVIIHHIFVILGDIFLFSRKFFIENFSFRECVFRRRIDIRRGKDPNKV